MMTGETSVPVGSLFYMGRDVTSLSRDELVLLVATLTKDLQRERESRYRDLMRDRKNMQWPTMFVDRFDP